MKCIVPHFSALLLFTLLFAFGGELLAEEGAWYERETNWNGFAQYHFQIKGKAAYIVAPNKPLEGNPWIWRARFPGYHAEMDVALVGKGFHLGYVDVAGLFGSPKAMEIADAFYLFATEKRKLAEKPCLEGVSRGGLVVYNWAAKHPEKVACIYCDTPVLDIKSWPGGMGKGVGHAATWRQCLAAYEFTEAEALAYQNNPIDHAEILAKAKIPILHIVSENDRIVPPIENTYVLQSKLKDHGHAMEIISVKEGTEKSSGHHFTHPEPGRVVEFILKHGR